MRTNQPVSAFQLSMLYLAYGTGSAIVNIPAPIAEAAGNSAWLSVIFGCMAGMLPLGCLLYISKRSPDLDLLTWSREVLGVWLTKAFSVLLLFGLCWMLPAIVMGIGAFFKSTMLKNTPSSVIQGLFFFMAVLTVRAGLEVMARMFLVLTTSMLVFIFVVLLMTAPNYHPELLLPVMPDGIKPMLHGMYMAYGFPFSECGLFAMLLPFVRKDEQGKGRKQLLISYAAVGLILSFSVFCTIMAEGPIAGQLKYSLYQLARLIYVQEIFERVESVIGFSLIAGSYMKASIVLFVMAQVWAKLFSLDDPRLAVGPLAFICFLLSVTMYSNESEFVAGVNVTWPLLNNIAFNIPLLVIAAATLCKRPSKKPAG